MLKCCICLEDKDILDFKINISCGHVCLCKSCFTSLLEHFEILDVDNNDNIINRINCPICRTSGQYINMYTTNLIELIDIPMESPLNVNNSLIGENSEYILYKLLQYGVCSNYKITTIEDNCYLYFNDNITSRNISKHTFLEAYYGTEFSYYTGKPYLINISERIKNILILNKEKIYIDNFNLCYNIDINKKDLSNKEKWYLYIVTKNI